MKGTLYLYRGTTIDWPGNPILQDERITCCSTDPLVAYLFAVECRTKGKAILYAIRKDQYIAQIAPDNHFSVIESAVNVNVAPSEFIEQSDYALGVEDVLNILGRIGFEDLPVHIAGKAALRIWLQESYNRDDRLSVDQLELFNREMEDVR